MIDELLKKEIVSRFIEVMKNKPSASTLDIDRWVDRIVHLRYHYFVHKQKDTWMAGRRYTKILWEDTYVILC